MSTITREEFKQALPDRFKKTVSDELVNAINKKLDNPEMLEVFRENLLGYTHVLKEGRFKMEGYIDAVKYVSYKLMGKTNIDAFSLVFPDRIKQWNANQMLPKDMASYISGYNKSKLVNLIYEQTLIPMHVLNRDNYQRAINAQLNLMINAKSEIARVQAANSVMTHCKPPETTKIELEINDKEDSTIDALRQSTAELVAMQRAMIEAGVKNAEQTARQPIVINQPAEQ